MGSVGAGKTVAERTSATSTSLSAEAVDRIVLGRQNGASYNAEERENVRNYLNSLDNGTVLQVEYARGNSVNFEKIDNDHWERSVVGKFGRNDHVIYDGNGVLNSLYGYKTGSPDAMGVKNLGTQEQRNVGPLPSFVHNSSKGTVSTLAGNMYLLDLAKSDVTKAHIAELERTGWKRRGKSDDTWYKLR